MRPCSHGFASPRILVVEDEGLIVALTVELLLEDGYEVRSAGDGGAALVEVRRWSPCLILLDIMMPVMDGRAFLHEFWRLGDDSETPVVLVSAVGGPTLADVSMRVADVIRKPFSIDRLLDAVRRLAS